MSPGGEHLHFRSAFRLVARPCSLALRFVLAHKPSGLRSRLRRIAGLRLVYTSANLQSRHLKRDQNQLEHRKLRFPHVLLSTLTELVRQHKAYHPRNLLYGTNTTHNAVSSVPPSGEYAASTQRENRGYQSGGFGNARKFL